MTKNIYIKPSVNTTELVMVQTLCSSGAPFSHINPKATTNDQL